MELHKIEKFNDKLKLFCQLEKPMLDWSEFRDNDRLISDKNFPTQVYSLNMETTQTEIAHGLRRMDSATSRAIGTSGRQAGVV